MRPAARAVLPFSAGVAAAVALVELASPGRTGPAALGIALASAALSVRSLRVSFDSPPSGAPPLGLPALLHSAPWAVELLLVGSLLGVLRSGLPAAAWSALPLSEVRAFRGIAVEDGVSYGDGRVGHRLMLTAVAGGMGQGGARGTVRLQVRGGELSYLGELVEVRGSLTRATGRGRDDFTAYAGAADVSRHGFGSRMLEARRSFRVALAERVRQIGYPVSGFFLAMFLGDREEVAPELQDLFRDSGCLHVLALSGTHLVLVFGAAAFLARRLPSRRIRGLVPLLVVALYVFAAGPLTSLLRALVMLVAAWVCAELERDVGGPELLALAVAALLLAEPRMLFDLSFQLSVCAVGGMVTVGAAVADRARRFVPQALALPLSAALGAQAAVAPLLLAAFGVFQPIGLVSGLVVAPLATVLLALGLVDVALPLGLPLELHAAMGELLRVVYRVLELTLRWFARFPQSISVEPVLALWAAILALLAGRLLPRLERLISRFRPPRVVAP